MAEVINLAAFQLDTSRLQSNLDQLQDTYFDLRKEQKAYTDQSKEVQKQIDGLAKSQKVLTDSAADNSEAIAANDKEMQGLLKTQKDLYKSEQGLATQMGTVKKEINQTTTQLRAYQDAEGKTNSLIDLGNAALSRQIKNKNDARAANIALNNVANQLNPNIAEEAKLLVQLNAQMDKNTNFIKENSSETAKQKMNIGNYSSALEGLDGVLAKFGINGQEARTVVSGFTSVVSKAGNDIVDYSNSAIKATASTLGFKTASQLASQTQATQVVATEAQTVANAGLATTTVGVTAATTASTLGLKAFTIALASTGIGLIVIALGALFSYLKDLDPLLDKIEQGFAAVGAVVRVLGSAIANLSFDGLGESMSNAADDAIKLKKAQQDLQDIQNSQEVANAKASQQYDELILKSRNRTLTEKERIAFLQQAEKIETANYTQRQNLATAELNQAIKNAQIKGQLSSQELKNLQRNTLAYGTYLLNAGKITAEDLENIKKAELGKIAIDAESTKRLEKNQNFQDKLFEDAETKRQKAIQDKQAEVDKQKQLDQETIDRALEKSQAEIDLFIAQQGFKKKSSQDEIKFNNALLQKELSDLKLQLKNKKISQTEYEAELLNLKNETASKNVEIVLENASLEIDAQLQKNATILANDQYLSDEQLRIKQEALYGQMLLEMDYQNLLLQNGKINQAEYNEAINRLNEENRLANIELTNQNKASEQEKQLIDLENKKIVDEENFILQAELDKERNAIKLEQELETAKKSGADIQLIKDKYAQMDKDIDTSVMTNKLNLASQTFGQLASILGENSKAGKAAAIAQATIDTYSGINSVWATKSILPEPFATAQKLISTAVVAKSGFDSVKKITATKQPTFKKAAYASGVIGLRGAGNGTSDDISANLSAGESVINARSTSMFANELSAINQAGGGVGLNGASSILNQNEIQSNVNQSQLVGMIAEAVAIGSEKGTSKGSQKGITALSDNRKIMNDAKF